MQPASQPQCSSVSSYSEVFEKSGANARAGFNGSAQRKGVQGGIGGTTKTTSSAAHLLHGKGENREAN